MKKYGKWIAVALLLSLVFAAVAVNYHKNGAERQNRLSFTFQKWWTAEMISGRL